VDYQLEKYLKILSKLRQAPTKYGKAPHKPILLLAIISMFDRGKLKSNIIYITPELVAEFKQLWTAFDIKGFNSLIAQPLFHMKSEGFWKLIPNFGFEKWLSYTKQCNSINILTKAVNRIEIDNELAELFVNAESRNIIKRQISIKYFTENETVDFKYNLLDKIGESLVAETPADYRQKIEELEEKLSTDQLEEELFIRSGAFRKEILKIYNSTCCISALKIGTVENISMVDACHIVSFSDSHDDTILNGISLCPNLHRAFDRGLITIDDSYRVCVSDKLTEIQNNPYSIHQFNRKQLILPEKRIYYPGITNFRVHRQKFEH